MNTLPGQTRGTGTRCSTSRPSTPLQCPSACISNRSRRSLVVCGARRRSGRSKKSEEDPGFTVDTLNPIQLGREARRVFDDVWDQFTKLASPTRSFSLDEFLDSEQEAPQASYTSVLVVGATGRVGRVVVRKLLLRGYKVKAMVRKRDVSFQERLQGLPAAIEFVEGDLGDAAACQEAVKGVDKIIFCAAARTTLRADLLRVEDRGVANLSSAFQDEMDRRAKKKKLKSSTRAKREIADFRRAYHQERWDITYCGLPGGDRAGEPMINTSAAVINDNNNLEFAGILCNRGALAEVGAELEERLPKGDSRVVDTEGLTLRVLGDGNVYSLVLRTVDSHRYAARFPTRPMGYSHVRLPYSTFRPETPGAAATIDPAQVRHVAIRFEQRRAASARGARSIQELDPRTQQQQGFRLEVDWIKALPGGTEPDFVMISAASTARQGMDDDAQAKLLALKRKGEENLRLSGLGYTIIRPGQLQDEPGGYKALVFDQGDRIQQGISFADVADICVRALHDPAARNKTFEVAAEYQPEGGEGGYELVAQVPDARNNYLGPALANLQKNT